MTEREKISELSAHWNAIEERIKEAEYILNEVAFLAINELRYAGRKIIDAWDIYNKPIDNQEDQKQFDDCLTVAKQYLLNADHDVTDAICLLVHRQVSEFVERYGKRTITKYFHDFPAFENEMKKINATVSGSRKNRHERVQTYDYIANEYIPQLLDYYQKLLTSAEIALADEKRQRFVNWCFAIFGILGSAASIISMLVYISF